MSHASIAHVVESGTAIASEIAASIESCGDALHAPDLRQAAEGLRSRGLTQSECVTLIEQVGRVPEAAERLTELRRAVPPDAARVAAFERYLLLLAATHYGARIARLRMGERVLRCFADELRFLAAPSEQDASKLLAPSDAFTAMAKVVTLRRFPAGQLHFELSGIPISWLLHLGPVRLTRLVLFLARNGRRRRPFFVHHIAWRRSNRLFLSEVEQNRSYYRMAQSLAMYPEAKGILAESWLHSPETYRVSPHLAWLNRPFLEHGGFVIDIREASEASGVFTGSRERRRLYDEGQFRPMTAMAIWPRAAVLDWAMRHPEFETA